LESVFESYSPNGELSEWFAMIDIGDGKFEDLNIAEKFGLKIELPSKNMVAILND